VITIIDEKIDFDLIIDLSEEKRESKHEIHKDLISWLQSEMTVSEEEKESKSGEKDVEIIVGLLKLLISSGAITAFIKLITQWIKNKQKNVTLRRKVELPNGTIITESLEINYNKIEKSKIIDFFKKKSVEKK
jgi:hypothetical protein